MSTGNTPPLSKILIPVDGSESSKRAVDFAGCVAHDLGQRIQEICVLNVLGGGYLSEHLKNVDVRAQHLLESDTLKQLKKQYEAQNVQPILEEAMKEIKKFDVQAPLNSRIMDGVPAKKIMECAVEHDYSTIFIGRRGLSAMKEFFIGSVAISLINQPGHPSVYIVSESPLVDHTCPVPQILIPIDGSDCSRAALEEALIFTGCYRDRVREVSLVRVIDPALYEEKQMMGVSPEQEARDMLDEAKRMLAETGVPEERVDTVVLYGRPAEKILEMTGKMDANILFMGKRGHSQLTDMVVGNVTNEIIHRCTSAVIAVAA